MNLNSIIFGPQLIWMADIDNFDEISDDLLNFIYEYREKNPQSENISNINGYQSNKFVHKETFLSAINQKICNLSYNASEDLKFKDRNIYITSSWININDSPLCYNTEHCHDETFSAVLYIKAPEKSGKIEFINDSLNPLWFGLNLVKEKSQFTCQRLSINPTEGQILLWPSYLKHSVKPNEHTDERISISFNILATPLNEF